MWMIVLFDLPVVTEKERKEATAFRKSLLDRGFYMAQYSVYFRLLSGKEAVDGYVKSIKEKLPAGGRVDIIMITDKQYENIISFSGKTREKNKKNPDQILLF
jgi:CRISPR-associated protein Cas2